MTDPVSFLRQYNINKKDILERNDQIIFGKFSWPKNVKTNYLVCGSGKEGKPKDYYSLQCLLYLLKNMQLRHSVYVEKARAENMPFVRRPDRKKLLEYLNGETSTSASIDKNAPIVFPNLEIGSDTNNEVKFIKKEMGAEVEEKKIGVSAEVSSKEVTSLINRVKHVIEGQTQQEIVKKPKLEEDEDKRKEDQPAARLNLANESSVTTDHIRSLSDAMPVEMIAAIKAKHLAKKRLKIKVEDDVQKGCTYIRQVLDCSVDVTQTEASDKQRQTHTDILPYSGKESGQIKSLSTKTLESTLNQMQKCCQTLCDNDPDWERSSSFERSLYKILKPYRNMLEEKKRNSCKPSTSVLPFLS